MKLPFCRLKVVKCWYSHVVYPAQGHRERKEVEDKNWSQVCWRRGFKVKVLPSTMQCSFPATLGTRNPGQGVTKWETDQRSHFLYYMSFEFRGPGTRTLWGTGSAVQ